MECAVHNGTILAAIFYAPIYFSHRTPLSDIWTFYTAPAVRKFVCDTQKVPQQRAVEGGGNRLVLIADDTDIEIEHSGLLDVASLTYAHKAKAHTVKLCFVCAEQGPILFRSPLFGGRTGERGPLEWIVATAEFGAAVREAPTVTAFVDRGFRGFSLPENWQDKAVVYMPSLLEEGKHAFAPWDCLRSKVRACQKWACGLIASVCRQYRTFECELNAK